MQPWYRDFFLKFSVQISIIKIRTLWMFIYVYWPKCKNNTVYSYEKHTERQHELHGFILKCEKNEKVTSMRLTSQSTAQHSTVGWLGPPTMVGWLDPLWLTTSRALGFTLYICPVPMQPSDCHVIKYKCWALVRLWRVLYTISSNMGPQNLRALGCSLLCLMVNPHVCSIAACMHMMF